MNSGNISWDLLMQIPLAGVVVFVVVLFLRHLKEVTAAFMSALAKQTTDAAQTQKDQTVLFMSAIKDQREENIESLSELADGFKSLGDLIAARLDEMSVAKAVGRVKAKK
jgi:hypothetical protein